MRIPAVSQDNLLCTRRAQASEQEWQPIHLSIRGVVSTFALFIDGLLRSAQIS
jgi:hypothetical protein